MRFFFTGVFCLFGLTSLGSVYFQKDSLMSLLAKTKEDTLRIKYYIDIGDVIDDPTESEYWYLRAKKTCNILLSRRGISEEKKKKITHLKADALLALGNCFQAKDDFIASILFFKDALRSYTQINDSLGMAIAYLNNGNNYFNLGQYSEALENYQYSAIIFKERNDLKGEAFCYNNIGGIHSEIGNLNLAVSYWNKTLTIKTILNDSLSIARTKNNLGIVYKNMGHYDKALSVIKEALQIFTLLDNLQGITMAYTNMSNIFLRNRNFENALKYSLLSLKIKKKLGDESGMALVYGNISLILNSLGRYSEAKKNAELGIELAIKTGSLASLKNNYDNISEAYAGVNNMEKAYYFLRKAEVIKDSLFNMEKDKEFTRLEMQYQVKSKEQEIEKQQAIIKKKEAIAEKNRSERNALIAGVILMILLLTVVIYSYIQKRKAHLIIYEKNQNLEIANAEILAQRDELEAQRDLVDMQKKQIEYIHKELRDSVLYGRRIQQSLLPFDNFLKTFFNEKYFLMYRPRDLVSGDFYWAAQMGAWKLFTVADCTGHGVPGAFMSMLGISLLNELIREYHTVNTADLLKVLFMRLSQNMHRKTGMDTVPDSMDIVFCAWNNVTNELQYSGINIPLYLVRNKELHTLKPTRMLNASEMVQNQYIDMKTVQLQKGDLLILSSDGYVDQFGGEKGKKFKRQNFRNLLVSLSDYPIDEQQKKIEFTFLKWKGTQNQIDDVCVMGIKI